MEFNKKYDRSEFINFLQHKFLPEDFIAETTYVDITRQTKYIRSVTKLGTCESLDLVVYEIRHDSLHDARVGLSKEAFRFLADEWESKALVLFIPKDNDANYRFSLITIELNETEEGKHQKIYSNPRRYSYYLGEGIACHTPNNYLKKLGSDNKTIIRVKDEKDLVERFSVEVLNKEFFNGYKAQYSKFLKTIDDTKQHRDYVKKLLGRLVFLQFLQKKGWMGVPATNDKWEGGDKNYLRTLMDKYKGNNRILSDVLEPLFFNTLNEKRHGDIADSRLGDNIKIPYLNGGLFDKDRIDGLDIDFEYSYFDELINFFSQYNFTIDENDPDDAEIGVDPEMLGHIFENLLEDNKDKGAFYTPKEIVQYMCQQSVIEYLKTHTDADLHTAIETLVVNKQVDITLQDKDTANNIYNLLRAVKVCDPAIGSGAFPMGVLNVLFNTRQILYGFRRDMKPFLPEEVKRDIIQNNIYGVDIEKGAVDIARLRFWLSIVVDEESPSPLPNLDYKIMQGNSLLESFKGVDLSQITKATKTSRAKKVANNQIGMDFSGGDISYNMNLRLNNYFSLTNHEEKKKLRDEINEDVRQFIRLEGNEFKVLDELNNINPSSNPYFFLWHTWFSDVFNRKNNEGFDIVIGNPPYIKEGRMSKTFFEPYKESPYYKGKMDIWYLFACNGLDLLNSNGVLCFIATNNWTTSFGASKLRDKVIKETRICNIVDFGAVMMFESASIQTMIMMFQKDKVTDDYIFDYRRLTAYKATEKEAIAILEPSYKTYEQAECYTPTIRRANFYDKNITFSQSSDILGVISSLSSVIYLNDKEIAQGIVFPQDTLNKKNHQKLGPQFEINQGIFVLTSAELETLALNQDELSLIKPYYTNENISRYGVQKGNKYWTIYTDSRYKNHNSLDCFPNIKRHLDRFVSVFTSDNKPYGLHRAREERFFVNNKVIAVRKCVGHPIFSYCDIECYLSQTFNMIQTDRVNLKYLTGLLNSKLIEFWLKNKGKMQGANYQLDKEPLQQIPIAVPLNDVQEIVAKLVDDILMQKKNNPQADTKSLEREIDFLVYKLYGLSYDEVLIVDPETAISREEYEKENVK